jgi:hypothetical protein
MTSSHFRAALAELEESFAGHTIESTSDDNDGLIVRVHALAIGDQHAPEVSAVAFVLAHAYPATDVYPHFLLANPKRRDGAALPAGMASRRWRDIDVVQVSRRSNHWKPGIDTAAIKLSKVLQWIRTR